MHRFNWIRCVLPRAMYVLVWRPLFTILPAVLARCISSYHTRAMQPRALTILFCVQIRYLASRQALYVTFECLRVSSILLQPVIPGESTLETSIIGCIALMRSC